MVRHGLLRKQQQEIQLSKKGVRTGFVTQGMHNKYAKISPGQWRNMFPELITYPDHEVVARGMALLKQREKERQ
ncbi:MAG: hypothetical protein NTY48_04445 [Candidatus Diapherotrites archaeon]|nr:hypothetical protein [Candidatus Diapherotrites archaeon]